jgi:hypothetical protein
MTARLERLEKTEKSVSKQQVPRPILGPGTSHMQVKTVTAVTNLFGSSRGEINETRNNVTDLPCILLADGFTSDTKKTVIVPVFTSCRRNKNCGPVILESVH